MAVPEGENNAPRQSPCPSSDAEITNHVATNDAASNFCNNDIRSTTSSATVKTATTPEPSLSVDAAVYVQQQDQSEQKTKHRSYAWLYRDLSVEEEYNIATVDGEDLDVDEETGSSKYKRFKPAPSPLSTPPKPVDLPPAEPVSQKPRTRCELYSKYHRQCFFQPFSQHMRRIKSNGCCAIFKPKVISIKDLDFALSTLIQDFSGGKQKKRTLSKRPHEATEDRHKDESSLPFKKRRRFLDFKSESVALAQANNNNNGSSASVVSADEQDNSATRVNSISSSGSGGAQPCISSTSPDMESHLRRTNSPHSLSSDMCNTAGACSSGLERDCMDRDSYSLRKRKT